MSEKVKVAYLDYSHIFAGAERVLHTIISHIDKARYEPILIFPYPMSHHDRYEDLDCEKIYLADCVKWWMGGDRWQHPLRGTDFMARMIFGLKLCSVLKREKINILHVNLLRPDSLMWLLPSRKSGVKIVGHFRSDEWEWMIPARVQKCCNKILCVSDYCKNRLLSRGKYVDTQTLYDSFDLAKFRATKSKERIKVECGIPTESFLITSIGQLSPHKGHDMAIRSFAKIADSYPNAFLYIVGGGEKNELSRLKDIQSRYKTLRNRIKFSENQVDNIVEIYRASDLVLSLTRYGEAFGLVPYEASVMDIPFIAPDGGAVKEFIVDGQSGLLVDTLDIDAVVRKITWVMEHPLDTAEMAKRAHYLVIDKLQPSVMCDNLVAVYESLYKQHL